MLLEHRTRIIKCCQIQLQIKGCKYDGIKKNGCYLITYGCYCMISIKVVSV